MTAPTAPAPLPAWEETPAEVAAWDRRWDDDDTEPEPDDDPDD